MEPSRAAIEAVFREEHGLVLAGLIRFTGDMQLAEDALQDAFVAALGAWQTEIPDRPAAWLQTTAKRKAIDRIRRARVLRQKYEAISYLLPTAVEEPTDTETIDDERLRLVFTCCHPALAVDARVALTLRTVGGLTTSEIARAFLVPEPTMAQRLVRAKRKIKDAGIPYRIPEAGELAERLPGVLTVIYLIFNEGYAASSGDEHVRTSLTAEAIRLVGIIDQLLPDQAEVLGLAALMQLHDARRSARTDPSGAPILLPDQDRTLWDRAAIDDAVALLDRALELRDPGPYQIQAAIAALHATSPTSDLTDWPQIVELYRSLATVVDSPVVTLNHAVAVAMAGRPDEGLCMIDTITGLGDYPYYHAARGALLAEVGDVGSASEAYARASMLTQSEPERKFLESRKIELGVEPG